MKQALKKIPFVKKIYQWIRNTLKLYSTQSFSQEGEDLILKKIFERQKKGFYVDVGAHHPFRFSNTYLFYKKGWRGINLDAMPESMKLFKKYRPRDINLEIPIGESDRELTYHIFNEPALNTFDASRIQEILKNPEFTLIKKIQIQIKSLKDILAKISPKDFTCRISRGGGYQGIFTFRTLSFSLLSRLRSFCKNFQYNYFER